MLRVLVGLMIIRERRREDPRGELKRGVLSGRKLHYHSLLRETHVIIPLTSHTQMCGLCWHTTRVTPDQTSVLEMISVVSIGSVEMASLATVPDLILSRGQPRVLHLV